MSQSTPAITPPPMDPIALAISNSLQEERRRWTVVRSGLRLIFVGLLVAFPCLTVLSLPSPFAAAHWMRQVWTIGLAWFSVLGVLAIVAGLLFSCSAPAVARTKRWTIAVLVSLIVLALLLLVIEMAHAENDEAARREVFRRTEDLLNPLANENRANSAPVAQTWSPSDFVVLKTLSVVAGFSALLAFLVFLGAFGAALENRRLRRQSFWGAISLGVIGVAGLFLFLSTNEDLRRNLEQSPFFLWTLVPGGAALLACLLVLISSARRTIQKGPLGDRIDPASVVTAASPPP